MGDSSVAILAQAILAQAILAQAILAQVAIPAQASVLPLFATRTRARGGSAKHVIGPRLRPGPIAGGTRHTDASPLGFLRPQSWLAYWRSSSRGDTPRSSYAAAGCLLLSGLSSSLCAVRSAHPAEVVPYPGRAPASARHDLGGTLQQRFSVTAPICGCPCGC